MQLTVKLGTVVAAGAAALMLAVPAALAGTQHAAASVTGPEVLSGSVMGKAAVANSPRIPLTLQGVVPTSAPGFLLGGGHATTHTVKTKAGNLVVHQTAKPTQSQTLNKMTCRVTYTNDLVLSVVGSQSTGAFAGASGPGSAQVYFSAIVPRYTSGPKKGQCDPSGNPKPKGAVATFLADAVLTTGS
jgi:hypothetical protein